MAFDTSWGSILLTMSKVFSGIQKTRESPPRIPLWANPAPTLNRFARPNLDASTKLNGLGRFVKGKEAAKILRGLHAHFLRRQSPQFAQLPRRFHHERRLVSLAPMRHRRQVGRVGFDKHAVERDMPGRVADGLRLGKGDITGKGNHESH